MSADQPPDECTWCDGLEEIGDDADSLTCPMCWPAFYGMNREDLPATPEDFIRRLRAEQL